VTNHHGLSIRCSLWDSDARITDTEKWLCWFDERGIAEPRREVDASRALKVQHKRDRKRWTAAMPEGLQPVWEDSLGQFGSVEIVEALETCRLTSEQTEGAARLFSGWSFRRTYPGGIRSVPEDLREVLLNHVRNAGEKDKLDRAKRALNNGDKCNG